jgi:hypothetical protein
MSSDDAAKKMRTFLLSLNKEELKDFMEEFNERETMNTQDVQDAKDMKMRTFLKKILRDAFGLHIEDHDRGSRNSSKYKYNDATKIITAPEWHILYKQYKSKVFANEDVDYVDE